MLEGYSNPPRVSGEPTLPIESVLLSPRNRVADSGHTDNSNAVSGMQATTKTVNIAARQRQAQPATGFGAPTYWLQCCYADDTEQWKGYNGALNAVKYLALGIMQIPEMSEVLLIDGKANKRNVKASETLEVFRRGSADGS